MKDGPDAKQKRNKPCENCRTHRRRCVNINKSICERCSKLKLNCIFKLSEKPAKPAIAPSISPARQTKLFDTIWSLNQEADQMQLQLSQLQKANTTTTRCQCQDPAVCQHIKPLPPSDTNSTTAWGLTISNDHRGIQLQTSVHSLSDLSLFIREAFSVFLYGDKLHPRHDFLQGRDPKQVLPVTHKSLAIEQAFRAAFAIPQEPPPPLSTASDNQMQLRKQVRFLKLQMIKIYFNCFGLLTPVFIHTWHYPQLQRNPDSLLATTIASYVAYSACTHVNMSGPFLFTRLQFAELCRVEAKEMLQDVLFDQEPSIDACLALWVMCNISLHSLKAKEARIQSSLCWQMVIQLKSFFLNPLLPDTTENMINKEVWKRVFFAARFMEFNFNMGCDNATDFSNIAHHLDIALPSLLPCETLDDRLTKAVLCYRYTSQLTAHSAGPQSENLVLRLMAGVIDTVPSNIIQHSEHTLMQLWDSIPEQLRLGSGPYRLMDPKCVEACSNASVLRFNLAFYIYWMNFQSRTMQKPDQTNLTAAAFTRIDGDRALVIASNCSDAASKLFKVLNRVMPCGVELHWLTMCCDILKMLSSSANMPVKQRALDNLHQVGKVLSEKLNDIGNNSNYAYASDAPYLLQIKKLISSYMMVNKMFVT